MAVSSSSRRTSTERGFVDSSVQGFLKQGNTLSRDSKINIGEEKPRQTSRVTDTQKREGLAKLFKGEGGTTQTGFLGQFSSMGQEELDRLTNSFLQRQANIKQRVAQPGRSGFLIQR